jgi:hypothetical protein
MVVSGLLGSQIKEEESIRQEYYIIVNLLIIHTTTTVFLGLNSVSNRYKGFH